MRFVAGGDDLCLVLSPADRRYLGIESGDRVDMEVVDGALVLTRGAAEDGGRGSKGEEAPPCTALQAAGAAYAAQVLADLGSPVVTTGRTPIVTAPPVESDGTAGTAPCPACGERVREEQWDDEDCESRHVARCDCGMVRLDGRWYVPMPEAEA